MHLILVRHASTAWSGVRYCGRSDPRLTLAGTREAATLATSLAPTLPARVRIVSSPSARAVATARAVADVSGHRSAIELDERWLETDFGIAEGRTFDELACELPELAGSIVAGSTSIDWPNGEAAAALAARVRAAWDDLIADGRDAVVVTHAGPLLHAVALARGLPPDLASIPGPAGLLRFDVAARGSLADPC